MYQQIRQTPSLLDGLLIACLAVGVLAGIIYGIKLYNSIVSTSY